MISSLTTKKAAKKISEVKVLTFSKCGGETIEMLDSGNIATVPVTIPEYESAEGGFVRFATGALQYTITFCTKEASAAKYSTAAYHAT